MKNQEAWERLWAELREIRCAQRKAEAREAEAYRRREAAKDAEEGRG